MKVTHFQRRPQGGQFSIERVFAAVREKLPHNIHCRIAVSTFPSRGVFRRLYNMIEVVFRQADVNHVTGDVHYLTLLLSRRKTLVTIHDCVSLHRLTGIRRRLLLFFWYTLPVRRAKFVSTVSESAKKELLQYVRCTPARVRVVPDCVAETFQKSPKEFNAQCPRVLLVGTGKNKNIPRVVEALAGLRCKLDIVGALDVPSDDALRQNGIDYFVSGNLSCDQMLEMYRRCDLLVFASTYEGFGLPILEANATGRPVVTSNISSMPEVAGDAACLVDPFDIASIRRGILSVLNDEAYRKHLIQRGYLNAARFSAQEVAAKYADIYRELAMTK